MRYSNTDLFRLVSPSLSPTKGAHKAVGQGSGVGGELGHVHTPVGHNSAPTGLLLLRDPLQVSPGGHQLPCVANEEAQ